MSKMKKSAKQTAKAIIFNKRGEVLILKTVGKRKRWDLPGGNREQKDKTIKRCALREIDQETGLRLRKIEMLGGWRIKGKLRHLFVATSKAGRVKLDVDEHDEHMWVKPQDLKKYDLKKKVIKLVRAYERKDSKPVVVGVKKKKTPKLGALSKIKLAA